MCRLCDNKLYLDEVRYALRNMDVGELQYCPVCGGSILMMDFFDEMSKYFMDQVMKAKGNIIEDEDGNKLLLERDPGILSKNQTPDILRPTKPRDMVFDLDKIDISKELEMLAEYENRNKAEETMNAIGSFFSQPKVAINPIVFELFNQFNEEQEDDEDDEKL